jgi:hypothetical protein
MQLFLSHENDSIKSSSLLSEIICNFTPKAFRHAVAKSGCFLYRGENSRIFSSGGRILCPQPDLLLEGTYSDPIALAYFQCMEMRLDGASSAARPSTGHIAISDISEASQWGEVVSVWPLGTSLSYVWPLKRKVFFPAASPTPGHQECVEDEIAINHDLATALRLGHEVLFASSFDPGSALPSSTAIARNKKSAFLAVPGRFENIIFDLMKKPEFRS